MKARVLSTVLTEFFMPLHCSTFLFYRSRACMVLCSAILALLAACSDGIGSVADAPIPPPVPSVPSGLTVTYAAKGLNFSWKATTHAATYQLFEDLDGAGPALASRVGHSTIASLDYAVPDLLMTRLNATYSLQACNISGCSARTALLQPNIEQAIGYFKASNPGVDDILGNALALSADGLTLAVSAYGEASASASTPSDDSAPRAGAGGNQSDNSASKAGAVYLY
jgi:hypothetical protein